MPTVLQINVCANYRSTGKIAEDIGQVAMSHGWRSVIAYGDSVRPSQSELIRIGSKFDLIEHWLETRIFDNHGLASRRATREFLCKVENINPDIIHLHNIHDYYLNYQLLFEFLSKKRIPVIWTLHDCWPFTGHCAYFDFVECDKWKKECYAPCPGKGQYPTSFFFDASRRNFKLKRQCFQSVKNITFVPVSEWLGKLLKQSFLSHYPIEVIHNGINLNVFYPMDSDTIRAKYHIGGGCYILGVAGVWDYRKGFDDFVKLKGLLSNDIKIVLVGLNNKQMQLAQSVGIIGIPHTDSPKELAALYSGALLYCNLTYEDNYPTTNLESMACGTPVLTYDTGGSVEAVTYDTGWVVEKSDLEKVVSIIEGIKTESQTKIDMQRKACYNRAQLEFNKNNAFLQYMELYERLIK